jgi:hypothetical protein
VQAAPCQNQGHDIVPLRGQFLLRQIDACVCLGRNRQEGGSLVGFVPHKSRRVDAHERTDFVDDSVKDLFGRHAPGEECGDPPKRGACSASTSARY